MTIYPSDMSGTLLEIFVTGDILQMKLTALVPQRESNVQTLLGDVNNLPPTKDGVAELKIQVESEKPTDLPLEFTSISMEDNGGIRISPKDGSWDLLCQYTRHALTQAVSRIKPENVVGMAGYLAVCPPDLRSINFNFWHQEKYGPDVKEIVKNNVLFRTRFGDAGLPIINAVVSQSYVPIDDLPLLKQFLDVIPEGSRIRSARGDVKSRYDVIWPTMKKELAKWEPLMVAVRLSNSEAGASSVRLEPMVHSIGGTATIVIPTIAADVSIRHIGEAGNKLAPKLLNTLKAVDPFIEMLNEAYSDDIMSRFNSLDQLFETVKKTFEFNDDVMVKVRDNLFKKNTRGDLIEAIARAASELPIEDGEILQKNAGLLAVKGWRLLTKHLVASES